MMKKSTKQMQMASMKIIGPITQTIPASSVFLFIDTSLLSTGMCGLGRRGGGPGGTGRISNERNSENGLEV